MSYGLAFTAQIHKVTPNTLQAEKEQAEDVLNILSEQLLALAADGSAKMYDDETDDFKPRYEIIAYKVPQMLADIVEVAGKLTLLNQADFAEDARVF